MLSHARLCATPWTAAPRISLSFIISRNLLKLMSIESVMPFNHLILVVRFSSCLQSFPASGSSLMSQLFAAGDQSIGASASAWVLPMNFQGWFPLGLTGLIYYYYYYYSPIRNSLCCVLCRFSRVRLYVTPWSVALQAPQSMGILQARILEWVAIPSSRGSSQPRGQTQVSHIAGGFFTIWATREIIIPYFNESGNIFSYHSNLSHSIRWSFKALRQHLKVLSGIRFSGTSLFS